MSKKYEYNANNFTLTDLSIKVHVSIAHRELKSLPIFFLLVSVEKKDGEDIEYYRCEAINKAKEVIVDIAKEVSKGDSYQNVLQERVIALEKQLTHMQSAMSCDLESGTLCKVKIQNK